MLIAAEGSVCSDAVERAGRGRHGSDEGRQGNAGGTHGEGWDRLDLYKVLFGKDPP